MVRQRAGTALRQALLQLSPQQAPASISSLARLCASACARGDLGAPPSFSSAAGQLLPELHWQQQQGRASTATVPVLCQQLISLRGFRGTIAAGKHALPIVHSHPNGGLPPLQRTQWQPAAQQWSSAADPPSGSQQPLQHQHAAAEVGSFRDDHPNHEWQTGRSPGAAWQRRSARQSAAPQLALGAAQLSGARQMHSVTAAWQRGGQQQTSATAPPHVVGQQACGFATAWQRGRAAQNLNKRGGRDAAPEPPKKPRTNSEIDGPHVRLVFPDGTHKVPPEHMPVCPEGLCTSSAVNSAAAHMLDLVESRDHVRVTQGQRCCAQPAFSTQHAAWAS
jgi:hypothetical protein